MNVVSNMNQNQERGRELPSWVPEGVDVTVPNAARQYDYLLGGYHNFAIDREFAERAEQIYPGIRRGGYANREFLGRAVRWLARAGIRQFLDIGSGIPTLGNVHEIAEQEAPEARVMYVDIDPIAVAHARAILSGHPRVKVLQADLRRPIDIMDHPDVTGLLDFSKPVAVVLAAVLHFIPEAADPYAIVGQLRDAVVSGSYIAVSHMTWVPELAKAQATVQQMSQQTPTPVQFRSREQIAQLLTGLDIVEPGLVPVLDWHPDPSEGTSEPWPTLLVAVGRKP
jgi:S-adenosyl methyltransferase